MNCKYFRGYHYRKDLQSCTTHIIAIGKGLQAVDNSNSMRTVEQFMEVSKAEIEENEETVKEEVNDVISPVNIGETEDIFDSLCTNINENSVKWIPKEIKETSVWYSRAQAILKVFMYLAVLIGYYSVYFAFGSILYAILYYPAQYVLGFNPSQILPCAVALIEPIVIQELAEKFGKE